MNLEAIILAGAVLILAVTLVVQGARASKLHQRIATLEAKPATVTVTQPEAEKLERELTQAYEAKIAEATKVFGDDLKGTSVKLSEQVSRLTTNVIESELGAYQKTLEEVRHTATEAMEHIRQAVEQQRVELRDGMQADLAAEREQLAAKLDTKLGDIVSSYIAESMGGGVDLGAQMQFIMDSLERHKADIKKDLSS